ncbi:MAG: hypothetical protein SPL39_00150 [Selenomonadaceae bacterium]|nr:hypothetical protein [Selenomonadaceae bacterium]
MSRFYGHGDKVAYFFIAFGLYLLFRAITEAHVTSLMGEALYISIAISLFASNVPRVMDIPLHLVEPIRKVEFFTFALALACFVALCLRYLI